MHPSHIICRGCLIELYFEWNPPCRHLYLSSILFGARHVVANSRYRINYFLIKVYEWTINWYTVVFYNENMCQNYIYKVSTHGIITSVIICSHFQSSTRDTVITYVHTRRTNTYIEFVGHKTHTAGTLTARLSRTLDFALKICQFINISRNTRLRRDFPRPPGEWRLRRYV